MRKKGKKPQKTLLLSGTSQVGARAKDINFASQRQKQQVINLKYPPKLLLYGVQNLKTIPQLQKFSELYLQQMIAVAHVLPFRSNNYVVEQLINWENIPDDPIFKLNFPSPDLLAPEDLNQMVQLIKEKASPQIIDSLANEIRYRLNPHPAGQKTDNVPQLNDEPVPGVQHKYKQTVLLFPSQGQHCHAYCSYCFRWPQFVLPDLKFATRESGIFREYLRQHQEVTDVLITGGDPMTLKAWQLKLYIDPLLEKDFEHIRTIRIGTKSVAYWPYRYTTDPDSEEMLDLFSQVVSQGKHLAIMGHYTHYRELETDVAQAAIKRIRATGAAIRCQTPIVGHVNDSEPVLAQMWQLQVELGCIPYYLFVERPTGASKYFQIPLIRALEIYQAAIGQVSGLGRTVRGPVMSCFPGKIVIEGVAKVNNEKVFVLSFLQARDERLCKQPFLAKFSQKATWFTDLKPAWGNEKFFVAQN